MTSKYPKALSILIFSCFFHCCCCRYCLPLLVVVIVVVVWKIQRTGLSMGSGKCINEYAACRLSSVVLKTWVYVNVYLFYGVLFAVCTQHSLYDTCTCSIYDWTGQCLYGEVAIIKQYNSNSSSTTNSWNCHFWLMYKIYKGKIEWKLAHWVCRTHIASIGYMKDVSMKVIHIKIYWIRKKRAKRRSFTELVGRSEWTNGQE